MTRADERDGGTVIYVSPLPPPAGGIATWTRTLVTRGLPGAWTPFVVDTAAGPGRQVFQRRGIWAEVRRAARVLARFSAALLRQRPGFVHINVDPMALGFYRDALCAVLARLAGVPVAIHYRGQVAELAEHPERRFHRWAVRRAAGIANLNLVLNDASRQMLRELAGEGVRVEKVPNFFDDLSLVRTPPPERAPGQRLQVVYAGGLTRSKGVAEILQTAARLPACDFHLLGRAYPELASELDAAPDNVILHGEVPHSEVLDRMVESHVLLFPSRHREGFPNVVCEAMALGLPAVASRAGAIGEMIDSGEGGLLCEPDPDDLVPALQSLAQDETRRRGMGEHNAEKAWRLYTYDRVTERLVSLYASWERCEGSSGR